MSGSELGGIPPAQPSLPPPPPPLPPSGPPAVGTASVVTGRRVVAGLIDLVPLTFLAIAMGDRSKDSGQFSISLQGMKVLWWLLAAVAYYLIAELATNTSPGKAIMGLCVRDDLATPPNKRQVLTRSAMRFVDILPVLYLVGLIAALSSSRRKRLGDMVAGTVVLQRAEVGEPRPGGRKLVSLAAVVIVTVVVGATLLVAADTSEKVGRFDFYDEVLPYADQVLEEAFQPPSVDAIRSHLAPGVVSENDLTTIVEAMVDVVGGITNDYKVDDHHFDNYPISPGKTVEAVSLRIVGQFEKRPGQLVLTLADVDGELRLIGFNFNA